MEQDVRGLRADELAGLRPGLVALVRRVLPPWLRDQAEDIVQSSIARVLERGDLRAPSSYLTRAAHNAAIDEIRRRIRRPEVAMDEEAAATTESRSPDPGREAESREIDRAVRACLAMLAGARRAAVVLFLLGHSREEVEAMSGWGKKRVEHLTYRGLADMRGCLESKGIAP